MQNLFYCLILNVDTVEYPTEINIEVVWLISIEEAFIYNYFTCEH